MIKSYKMIKKTVEKVGETRVFGRGSVVCLSDRVVLPVFTMPKLRSERVTTRRALPRGQPMATDDHDNDEDQSAPAGAAPAAGESEVEVTESVISAAELASASAAAAATDGDDDGAAAAELDFPALSAKELSVRSSRLSAVMLSLQWCQH